MTWTPEFGDRTWLSVSNRHKAGNPGGDGEEGSPQQGQAVVEPHTQASSSARTNSYLAPRNHPATHHRANLLTPAPPVTQGACATGCSTFWVVLNPVVWTLRMCTLRSAPPRLPHPQKFALRLGSSAGSPRVTRQDGLAFPALPYAVPPSSVGFGFLSQRGDGSDSHSSVRGAQEFLSLRPLPDFLGTRLSAFAVAWVRRFKWPSLGAQS